jgi:hypothetical protein
MWAQKTRFQNKKVENHKGHKWYSCHHGLWDSVLKRPKLSQRWFCFQETLEKLREKLHQPKELRSLKCAHRRQPWRSKHLGRFLSGLLLRELKSSAFDVPESPTRDLQAATWGQSLRDRSFRVELGFIPTWSYRLMLEPRMHIQQCWQCN